MAELIEVDDLTQIATVVVENVETITVDGSTDSITIDAPATIEVIDVATPGPQGEGMPAGGLENQVAYKQSDTDFDIGWETLSADLVAYDDTGNTYITGSTVQAALDETDVQGAIVHQFYLDVADAFGTISDFIVQVLAAIGDVDAHLTDTSDAHDASAISVVPAGSISATDVQAALAELDSEKSPLSHVHSTSDITSLAEFVRDTAGLTFVEGANIEITVDDPGDTITIGVTGSLGVSDHGDLTGLSDNDHPQYVLKAGDTMSGSLVVNGGGANETTVSTTGLSTVDGGSGAYGILDAGNLYLNDGSGQVQLVAYLGQLSTGALINAVGGLALFTNRITGVGDPVAAQDADTLAARNAAIAAHTGDTTDAHDASAISILDTANDFTATDVEGALAELQSDAEADATALTDHIADAVAAHVASAIGLTPTGDVSSTDVQAAIAELASEKQTAAQVASAIAALVDSAPSTLDTLNELAAALGDDPNFATTIATMVGDHISDTSDAHDASAISILDTANDFTATDVEGALAELQTDVEAAPILLPTTDARNVIQPSAATVTPLTLRGFTAQSDPLLSLEDSASTVLARFVGSALQINSTGSAGAVEKFRVDTPTTVDALANVILAASTTTAKPLVVQGYPSQTATLTEWQNSAGTILSSLMADGSLWVRKSGTILYGYGGSLQQRDVIQYNSANEYTSIVSNASEKLRAPASGGIQIGAFSTSPGTVERFFVYRPTTMDNSANSMFCPSATTSKPLVVQALAAQSANLTEWQSSAGAVLSAILSGGQLAFGTNPPTAGAIRMANGSTLGVQFRDNAGTGNLRGIDATTADSISIAAGQIVANSALTTVDIATRLRINNTASFGAVTKLQINGGANSTDVIFIELLGATDIGLVVKAASAHSGALQQWRSSAGTVMSSVDAAGRFLVPLGALATVGMGFTGDPNTGTYSPGADAQSMVCGGVAQLDLTTTTLIVNEGGADFDVRIESDGDANNLFSDGGANRVGIGTGAPDHKLHVAGRVHSTVGFTSAVVAHGNTGATETIDLDAGDTHTATMDASCIFTFSNPVASGVTKFTLFLAQGSGGQTATWPGTVLWAGGTDPTLSTGAGEIDVLTFITTDGGTTWHGFLAGADMS